MAEAALNSATDDHSVAAPLAKCHLLSIIIPVCDEYATIEEVVRRLEQLGDNLEILIVDDGSADGTSDKVRQLAMRTPVKAFFHARNLGKGAAIRTALADATGDIIVIQDADLEYNPTDIAKLIEPIATGIADVAYGSRFAGCNGSDWRLSSRIANRLLTWFSNRFTGLCLTDMETCYKAMRRENAAELMLREDRFGFEPEFAAKVARHGCRIVEVPVSYNPRKRSAGKKIGFLDGLRALWCIVRYSRWD
jgi:glycosyltransferase involved in cell wall biosynthesis